MAGWQGHSLEGWQACIYADRQKNSLPFTQRQLVKQAGRQTARKPYRQTDRWTDR